MQAGVQHSSPDRTTVPLATRPPRVTATCLFIFAALLTVGGVKLILLSGSWYFAVTGVWLAIAAILLWRGSVVGGWLYLAMLIGTLVWSVSEVGFTFWPLVPRLLLPLLFGLWLLTPWVRRGLH